MANKVMLEWNEKLMGIFKAFWNEEIIQEGLRKEHSDAKTAFSAAIKKEGADIEKLQEELKLKEEDIRKRRTASFTVQGNEGMKLLAGKLALLKKAVDVYDGSTYLHKELTEWLQEIGFKGNDFQMSKAAGIIDARRGALLGKNGVKRDETIARVLTKAVIEYLLYERKLLYLDDNGNLQKKGGVKGEMDRVVA